MQNRSIPTSKWGPYSNNAIGICHTYDDGNKLCVIPFCGRVSRQFVTPQMRVVRDNFLVIEALPDLSYYRFRYKLDTDNSVYIDVRYFTVRENSAVIEFCYINNGKNLEFLQSDLIFNAETVPPKVFVANQGGNIYVHGAENYYSIDYTKSRWADSNYGVFNDNLAIGGKVFSFDVYRGKAVVWKFPLTNNYMKYCRIRYSLSLNEPCLAAIAGCDKTIVFKPTGGEYLLTDYIKLPDSKILDLNFTVCNTFLKLDSFILSDCECPVEVRQDRIDDSISNAVCDDMHSKVSFSLPGLKSSYSVVSDNFYPPQKEAFTDKACYKTVHPYRIQDFDEGLPGCSYLPYKEQILPCKILITCSKIVKLQPGESQTHRFTVSANCKSDEAISGVCKTTSLLKKYEKFSGIFNGKFKKFAEHLSAQTFCNISFPHFLDGKPVKYYTPAKSYGSLYLWDMGMTGIGMSNLSMENAKALLNQYLNENRNGPPFVAWGTMLPIHIFLYWNIFNKENDKKFLVEYYDKIVRMYDFFTGHSDKSVMRDSETGLINNFRYNYNSGWDDYPAQQLANRADRWNIFSVVSTSQVILTAKIMLMVSKLIGKFEDVQKFQRDIASLEQALEKYHWNQKESLYSYYDKNSDRYFSPGRAEPNKGLDGYYPLVSSSVDIDRARNFVNTLFDKQHCWTDYGLTTVDKSSIYFDHDGYWNGHVWPPHNWFYWKALLDYGMTAKAKLLADSLLSGYEKEFEKSGVVFEALDCETGRGKFVPYFSGLTAPMLDIYMAYYGGNDEKVTGGFLISPQIKRDGCNYELEIFSGFIHRKTGLILRLKADSKYELFPISNDNRSSISFTTDEYGIAELALNIEKEITVYNIAPVYNKT